MSPTADIETLFKHGHCDPCGCVLGAPFHTAFLRSRRFWCSLSANTGVFLGSFSAERGGTAVTLAKEDFEADAHSLTDQKAKADKSSVDAPQKLRYLVTKHAARHGLVALVWGRRFSYGAAFSQLCDTCGLMFGLMFGRMWTHRKGVCSWRCSGCVHRQRTGWTCCRSSMRVYMAAYADLFAERCIYDYYSERLLYMWCNSEAEGTEERK